MTGENEGMRRAHKARLEELRARKESGRISKEIAWKGKESGQRQVKK